MMSLSFIIIIEKLIRKKSDFLFKSLPALKESYWNTEPKTKQD